MKNRIIIFIALLVLAISCEKAPTSPEELKIKNGFGKRGYRLQPDEEILALNWNDNRKKEYFYTNWMNTITNQSIKPAGVTGKTRYTDENGNYYENDGTLLGEFQYATNVTLKNGLVYIGALYKNPTQPNSDSKWMIFRIAEDGGLYNLSGYNTGATGNTPPTEDKWDGIMKQYGDYSIGTIKLD